MTMTKEQFEAEKAKGEELGRKWIELSNNEGSSGALMELAAPIARGEVSCLSLVFMRAQIRDLSHPIEISAHLVALDLAIESNARKMADQAIKEQERADLEHKWIGSVSTGTLRQQDLLNAFADELESRRGNNILTEEVKMIEEARELAKSIDKEFDTAPGVEEASDMIFSLMDKLTAIAPDGIYFGANEGDGADFGFWPIPADW